MLITWENIDEYFSIPIEYRFIDKADVVPGKEAYGVKLVSSQDWYFTIHFPKNPIVPGVFLMEAMQQTGLLIVTTMPDVETKFLLFHACESMRMYRSVRPGDALMVHVVLDSFKHGIAKFYGEITLSEPNKEKSKLVCSMRFTLLEPKEFGKITLSLGKNGGGCKS